MPEMYPMISPMPQRSLFFCDFAPRGGIVFRVAETAKVDPLQKPLPALPQGAQFLNLSRRQPGWENADCPGG
jgi:hypothetical protein